jgi:hypothetical protein
MGAECSKVTLRSVLGAKDRERRFLAKSAKLAKARKKDTQQD